KRKAESRRDDRPRGVHRQPSQEEWILRVPEQLHREGAWGAGDDEELVDGQKDCRPVTRLIDPAQFPFVLRRLIEPDLDVERKRLVARRAHFDAMWTGREMEALKDSVEIVDDTD